MREELAGELLGADQPFSALLFSKVKSASKQKTRFKRLHNSKHLRIPRNIYIEWSES